MKMQRLRDARAPGTPLRTGADCMVKETRRFLQASRRLAGSAGVAAFVLVSVVLLYGSGQEILAENAPYDDYYFLLRSESFTLMGSHLAPLREYLYPLFIKIARIYGLSLRNFEAVSYALALTWLWSEVRKLTRSSLAAWLAVLPLALFTYQSRVFYITEYDALQLVLTPFTIASAIMVYRSRGGRAPLFLAGLVAAAQVLTRPEGALFLLPPLLALALAEFAHRDGRTWWRSGLRYAGMAIAVCVVPVLAQQAISAANYVTFGFWAPTFLKSSTFTGAESALMSIRPAPGDRAGRYAPVPISSMQQAYRASPAFLKADPYFAKNLGGKGWSMWAPPGYATHDGSIDGGHFPFALIEASAQVAGPEPKEMLAYLAVVKEQLDEAFRSGALRKRLVLSAELGPNFSLLSPHYWDSVGRILKLMLDIGAPIKGEVPQISYRTPDAKIESDYNRLALRRTSLVYTNDWRIEGWVLDRKLGLPDRITLSERAMVAGVGLKLINRPDVAKVVLGLPPGRAEDALVGYQLYVPDAFRKVLWAAPASPDDAISVDVWYGDDVTRIPVSRFIASEGAAFSQGQVEVQEERVIRPPVLQDAPGFTLASRVWWAAYRAMRFVFIGGIVLFIGRITWWYRRRTRRIGALALMTIVAFSLLLPRVAMLAGVDAFMFPGTPPRYVAAGAFALWLLALFVWAEAIVDLCRWVARRVGRRLAPGA